MLQAVRQHAQAHESRALEARRAGARRRRSLRNVAAATVWLRGVGKKGIPGFRATRPLQRQSLRDTEPHMPGGARSRRMLRLRLRRRRRFRRRRKRRRRRRRRRKRRRRRRRCQTVLPFKTRIGADPLTEACGNGRRSLTKTRRAPPPPPPGVHVARNDDRGTSSSPPPPPPAHSPPAQALHALALSDLDTHKRNRPHAATGAAGRFNIALRPPPPAPTAHVGEGDNEAPPAELTVEQIARSDDIAWSLEQLEDALRRGDEDALTRALEQTEGIAM